MSQLVTIYSHVYRGLSDLILHLISFCSPTQTLYLELFFSYAVVKIPYKSRGETLHRVLLVGYSFGILYLALVGIDALRLLLLHLTFLCQELFYFCA